MKGTWARRGLGWQRRARAIAGLLPLLAAGRALAVAPEEGPIRSLLHEVRPGETAESLAAAWYGDRQLALFIREANGLVDGRLPTGKMLRIPTAAEVRVRRGDTLQRLSRRLLGDARRARFLAEWNGIRQEIPLQIGQRMIVPFHLVHRAQAPESLAAIARAFYRDPAQGSALLVPYNFRSASVLAPGETVIVPVLHVRVKPHVLAWALTAPHGRGRPPPEPKAEGAEAVHTAGGARAGSAAPQGGRRTEWERHGSAGDRIKQAEHAFAEANYEEAQMLLAELAAEPLSKAGQLAIHRLLGFVYATVGDEAGAVREFRAVLALDPALVLDPQTVSPKIRAVFERARASQ